MILIKELHYVDLPVLQAVMSGHESIERYEVVKDESDDHVIFHLKLAVLPQVYQHQWQPEKEDLELYQKAFSQGTCLGAYDD